MPTKSSYRASRLSRCLQAAVFLFVTPLLLGAQECDPLWSSLDGDVSEDLGRSISALKVFDDGAGPALYAGGSFTTVGGIAANRVARWDGLSWSALESPGGNGTNNRVFDFAIFDDGSGPALFASGAFTTAGGVATSYVAKWDGTTWSALEGPSGEGTDNPVWTLEVFDDGNGPALYAGGSFLSAGGVNANGVARWDGENWSALGDSSGNGIGGGSLPRVFSLKAFDDGSGPALYAAGRFLNAGGVPANRVAKWDGSNWFSLNGPSGNGVNNTVGVLEVFDDGDGPDLYVGGAFTLAGGLLTNRIARWDGTNWSALVGPMGNGITQPGAVVTGLQVYNDGRGSALYVGGGFIVAGGIDASRIASWDGGEWSALEGPQGNGLNGTAGAMAVFNDGSGSKLYVGGNFFIAGGVEVNDIARWGSPCTPIPCPADVTGDAAIDLLDLNLVLANFGQSTSNGDTNGDSVVDKADLNAILAAFGTDCP